MSSAESDASDRVASLRDNVDLDSLLRELPAVVFVAEPGTEGEWLYMSPQIEQILGFTPEEWYGHPTPFATHVHPDDFERLVALEQLAVDDPDQRPSSREFRMFRKDGAMIWVHDRVTVIDGPDGEPLIQGLLFDISSLRAAKDAQSDTDRRFRALIGVAPLGVITWDRGGTILSWNAAAERIFGWTEAEAVGRFLPQVQETERDGMVQAIDRAFRGEVWENLEVVRQRKDGTPVDISVSAAALRGECGEITAMMSIISDITARKRTEGLLQQQQEELRRRAQLDAIGRLAAGIAHDFNNLLTVIHGEAALALDTARPGSSIEKHLQPIVAAAERATELTRQLLAFGRRQVLELEAVQLNEVIDAIVPLLRTVAGENIDVRIELGDVLPVEADSGQIDQVLVNLVGNARDAMPRGGAILIETRSASIARSGEDESEHTLLVVTDTGMGIDESALSQVFDPFFTTKGTDQHTGLGLSSVNGIVAQCGGFIDVASVVGSGTSFTVHLPAIAVDAISARPEPSVARPIIN